MNIKVFNVYSNNFINNNHFIYNIGRRITRASYGLFNYTVQQPFGHAIQQKPSQPRNARHEWECGMLGTSLGTVSTDRQRP